MKRDELREMGLDTFNYIYENENLITEYLINLTKYYPEGKIHSNKEYDSDLFISIERLTSLEAIQKYKEDYTILNFASAKTPGGGFLRGAQAQEETLARSSNLYMSLVSKKKFYDNPTAPYYTDRVIYSPNVMFFKNDNGFLIDNIFCSVITCAAPNLSVKHDLKIVKEKVLERIDKVLQVAIDNDEKKLILGAWGCGVFKNPPEMVAECFKTKIEEYKNFFEQIIFAIPGNDENYRIFNKILGNK